MTLDNINKQKVLNKNNLKSHAWKNPIKSRYLLHSRPLYNRYIGGKSIRENWSCVNSDLSGIAVTLGNELILVDLRFLSIEREGRMRHSFWSLPTVSVYESEVTLRTLQDAGIKVQTHIKQKVAVLLKERPGLLSLGLVNAGGLLCMVPVPWEN